MKIEIACELGAPNKDKGDLLENLFGELMESLGYSVEKQIRMTGVELDLLCKHEVSGKKVYVECKSGKKNIDAGIIKELIGTAIIQELDEAWLVTTSSLGKEASGLMKQWKKIKQDNAINISIYTPEQIIKSLVNTSIILDAPKQKAIDFVGSASSLGGWTLLVTVFGRYWIVSTLRSGEPHGALVYSANTGKHVRDKETLAKITALNAEVNEFDLSVGEINSSSIAIKKSCECTDKMGPMSFGVLPRAPSFVGRESELQLLDDFYSRDEGGIFVLEALGGCGKTALVADWFDNLHNRSIGKVYDFAFFWSFYDNNSSEVFLGALWQCLSGLPAQSIAYGMHVIIYICKELSRMSNPILVLDGLERVQVDSDAYGRYGEICDYLLKYFIANLGEGRNSTKAFITTRFPVKCLQDQSPKNMQVLELEDLDVLSAVALFKSHNILCNEKSMQNVFDEYGGHALTLDHLGGYIARHLDHSIERIVEIPALEKRVSGALGEADVKGKKLYRVLKAYQDKMTSNELAIMRIISAFKSGVTEKQLYELLVKNNNFEKIGLSSIDDFEARGVIESLVSSHLVIKNVKNNTSFTCHPAIMDFFFYDAVSSGVRGHDISEAICGKLSLSGRPGRNPEELQMEEIEDLLTLFHHQVRAGHLYEANKLFSQLGRLDHLIGDRGLLEFTEKAIRDAFGFRLGKKVDYIIKGYGECRQRTVYKQFYDYWIACIVALGSINAAFLENVDCSNWDFADYYKAIYCQHPTKGGRLNTNWSLHNIRYCLSVFNNLEDYVLSISCPHKDDNSKRYLAITEFKCLYDKDNNSGTAFFNFHKDMIVRTGEAEISIYYLIVEYLLNFINQDYSSSKAAFLSAYNFARECHFQRYVLDLEVYDAIIAKKHDVSFLLHSTKVSIPELFSRCLDKYCYRDSYLLLQAFPFIRNGYTDLVERLIRNTQMRDNILARCIDKKLRIDMSRQLNL